MSLVIISYSVSVGLIAYSVSHSVFVMKCAAQETRSKNSLNKLCGRHFLTMF